MRAVPWLALALALAGCNRFNSPMAIKNCAIEPARAGGALFAADVQNQRKTPAVAFSIMAARTGRIVVANGDNIANYDFKKQLAPGGWAHVEIESPHDMRTVTDCTVAHIDFADGSYWSMPTPEF